MTDQTEVVRIATKQVWWKQKTSWTAIGAVVAAIGGYVAGEINFTALIAAVFAAAGTIFMRQGVEKSKPLTELPPSQRGEEVK